MLRDEMELYTKLTGEDATHIPIIKIGAYLDGYDKGVHSGFNLVDVMAYHIKEYGIKALMELVMEAINKSQEVDNE